MLHTFLSSGKRRALKIHVPGGTSLTTDVRPEAGAVGEGPAAGGAAECLHLVVHVHMADVVTSHGEPFPAHPAHMGHLLQVDAVLVASQPRGGCEGGITQVTLKALPLAQVHAKARAHARGTHRNQG